MTDRESALEIRCDQLEAQNDTLLEELGQERALRQAAETAREDLEEKLHAALQMGHAATACAEHFREQAETALAEERQARERAEQERDDAIEGIDQLTGDDITWVKMRQRWDEQRAALAACEAREQALREALEQYRDPANWAQVPVRGVIWTVWQDGEPTHYAERALAARSTDGC